MNEFTEKIYEIEEWLIIEQVASIEIYVLAFFLLMAFIVVIGSKKFRIPVVVGYICVGVLLSVDLINRLPFLSYEQKAWYSYVITNFRFISDIALAFIAFTIGSELSFRMIKKMSKILFYIVPMTVFFVFSLVFLVLIGVGQPVYVALLLAAIACITAPAATMMVLKEYNAEGPVTSTIIAVVGIGDAFALVVFSIIRSNVLVNHPEFGFSGIGFILGPIVEILGAVVFGLLLGYFSQRYLAETEGKTRGIFILITTVVGGTAISLFLNFSPLITNMAVGFSYRNFARKNLGIAGYLETITIPVYALFFILAGTKIQFEMFTSTIFILTAILYLVARILGKVCGTYLAARLAGASDNIRKFTGIALFSQSGVAIALAYIVRRELTTVPETGLFIFNLILLTSVLMEIFGPLAVKYAIFRAGESRS